MRWCGIILAVGLLLGCESEPERAWSNPPDVDNDGDDGV